MDKIFKKICCNDIIAPIAWLSGTVSDPKIYQTKTSLAKQGLSPHRRAHTFHGARVLSVRATLMGFMNKIPYEWLIKMLGRESQLAIDNDDLDEAIKDIVTALKHFNLLNEERIQFPGE